jgi:hypothetical protein
MQRMPISSVRTSYYTKKTAYPEAARGENLEKIHRGRLHLIKTASDIAVSVPLTLLHINDCKCPAVILPPGKKNEQQITALVSSKSVNTRASHDKHPYCLSIYAF